MNIAVIIAHPDDAEIWCGGTILKHTKRGDRVTIFGFFQQSSYRIQCAQKSAELLGASYVSCQPDPIGLNSDYADKIRRFNPNIILTHWEDDSHPDHIQVQGIAMSSIIHLVRAGIPPQAAFSFTTYHNRGRNHFFQPDFYINIAKEWEAKVEAIRIHDSECPEEIISEIDPLFRVHGNVVSFQYAEVFRESPIFGRLNSKLRSPDKLN